MTGWTYSGIGISNIDIKHREPTSNREWNSCRVWRVLEYWWEQVTYNVDCDLGVGKLYALLVTAILSEHVERECTCVRVIVIQRNTDSDVTSGLVKLEVGVDLVVLVEILDTVRNSVPGCLEWINLKLRVFLKSHPSLSQLSCL